MIYVDTSILVRASVARADRHAEALEWIDGAGAETGLATSTHALAELFSVVSGFFQTPHDVSRRIVARVRQRFSIVTLDEGSYLDAIERTMQIGRSGPTVYDALHVVAADKVGATRLASADEKSFPFLLPASMFVNPIRRA